MTQQYITYSNGIRKTYIVQTGDIQSNLGDRPVLSITLIDAEEVK